MSNDAEFCRQQADKQRADAADASLSNVRDRCERAASSWDVMAARAERTQKLRLERSATADGEASLTAGMPLHLQE